MLLQRDTLNLFLEKYVDIKLIWPGCFNDNAWSRVMKR
jgi:hypothetical protein